MASLPGEDMLPAALPLFPLTGAILLPRARLPLNIFEPRYLAMTRDTMGSHRMIGMIQPSSGAMTGKPELFRIGCAGRITQFAETPDGRFLITLTGISRFVIVEELSVATPYRQALVRYDDFARDCDSVTMMAPDLREALLSALRHYVEALSMATDWDDVRGSDDEALVNALAMACPFHHAEKQALLEAVNVPDRARVLIALMSIGAAGGDGAPVRH